ncbi:MAG: phage tail tape measure protein [Planctomycetaceae bacterium]|nr:MAG: phage tail tape measure protein [Planctomycetaceae bacterium]
MGATALKATAALGAVGIAAGAAFGVAGVKSAADFEEALSRSIGLASLLPEEVDKVRDALLKLAPEVGKGPQELAEAFYFASSAGLDTAKAMAAVESSAKAAAAGMGETKVIVDAVTSVMNAYGLAADQASRVTDALVNTVKLGKGEPEDLAASIGRVIPVAAEMGVSIEEVGASMAVMTRIGLDADESATALRGSLVALLKPSSTAETALAKIGKSAAGLRQEIKTKGLAATLVDLMDALGGNEEALVDIFPEVRALTGVLATAGNQSEEYIKVLDEMNDGLGATDDAFAEASDTFTFKMSQLKSSFDVLKIKVGNELLPVLKRFADWLIDIQPKIQAFGSEVRQRVTPALQAFGNWFETTGLPALQAFADSMATNLGPAFSDLRTWLTNDLVPKLQEFGEALGPKLQGAIENIGPVLGTMASGFQDIAKAVGDFLGSKIISDPAFIAAAIAIALAPLAIGIATNPVGLAIAGIGALALALGLFSQKIDEQPEPMLKWRKGILEFRRDLGQLEVDIIDFAQTMTTKPISVALNVVLPGVGPLLDEAAKGLNELAKKGIGIPQEMEDIDAELADVQARLDTFSTQRSVDALDDLKKSGDKVPQTFATMADTTIASMIDLNQMTTAPIRGDIDKLTTGANLARDAAGKMAGAWDQALRDSTADFQAIA